MLMMLALRLAEYVQSLGLLLGAYQGQEIGERGREDLRVFCALGFRLVGSACRV